MVYGGILAIMSTIPIEFYRPDMQKKIQIALLTLILTLAFYACRDKNIPFNKNGWNEDADGEPCPPLRNLMLDDLLSNHKLKDLTFHELILKLGNPDNHQFTEPNLFRYEISVDYTTANMACIKALDFYLSEDSIISSWKVVQFEVDM